MDGKVTLDQVLELSERQTRWYSLNFEWEELIEKEEDILMINSIISPIDDMNIFLSHHCYEKEDVQYLTLELWTPGVSSLRGRIVICSYEYDHTHGKGDERIRDLNYAFVWSHISNPEKFPHIISREHQLEGKFPPIRIHGKNEEKAKQAVLYLKEILGKPTP